MANDALWRAMQSRVTQDFARSVSIGRRRSRFYELLHKEIEDFVAGLPEGVPPTAFQRRFSDAIEEADGQLAALLEALGRSPDLDDPVAAAAVDLVGSLGGRVLALDARLLALEAAVEVG